MKSIKFLAYAGAIALLSTAGLSSCNNQPEPTNGMDREVVKTQFSLTIPNVSNGAKAPQRMQAGPTQADATFNGIKDITLIPFGVLGDILSTSPRWGDNIALAAAQTDNTASTTKATALPDLDNKATLSTDVSIPVGTASFLFYGNANLTNSTVADKFANGVTNMTITEAGKDITNVSTPGGITFAPEVIYSTGTTPAGTNATAIANYLSSIAQAHAVDANGWYQTTSNLHPLYEEFTTANITAKAGSAANVKAMVEDLYFTLKPNTDDESAAIKAAILAVGATEGTNVLNWTVDFGNFPADINLPDGAVQLTYATGTKTFSYVDAGVNMGTNMNAKNTEANKYVYPAQMWYVVNSQIYVANESKAASYSSAAAGTPWNDFVTATYGTTKGSVSALTRSVAIDKPINYAVARFDVNVKRSASTVNDAASVAVTTAEFPVTGVLVGTQNKVDYMFHKTGSDNYTVYDKATGVTCSTTSTDYNYTLLLETAADENIYFAVELQNNGDDFMGADGVVAKGCKFYLVGELKAADATKTSNMVFKQDYVTKANCTIKSLANAYNCIPDLRAPKMELGLSVDLTWESGHVYTVEF